MEEKKKFYELNEEPEEGMVLCGFSCECILSGKELKEKIFALLKNGEIGFREAVELFKKEAMASFSESLRIIREMRKDYKKNKNLSNNYKYVINRVFWCFETDIPENDIRYCKLNLVDTRDINIESYKSIDGSLDLDKFIKENSTKSNKKIIQSKIIDSEKSIEEFDEEWNNKRV